MNAGGIINIIHNLSYLIEETKAKEGTTCKSHFSLIKARRHATPQAFKKIILLNWYFMQTEPEYAHTVF